MTIDKVRAMLMENGLPERLHEFETSSATVELAAQCLGVEPARIAKTLSFYKGEDVILVVMAGTARIDNHKFKERFGCKAKMLPLEDMERLTGNAAGSVCPFLAPEGVAVWLDVSLKAYDTVYPSAGSSQSCITLTCEELEALSRPAGWCDVCKAPEA